MFFFVATASYIYDWRYQQLIIAKCYLNSLIRIVIKQILSVQIIFKYETTKISSMNVFVRAPNVRLFTDYTFDRIWFFMEWNVQRIVRAEHTILIRFTTSFFIVYVKSHTSYKNTHIWLVGWISFDFHSK